MNIKVKLLVLNGASLIVFAGVVFALVWSLLDDNFTQQVEDLRANLLEERRILLRDVVGSARGVMEHNEAQRAAYMESHPDAPADEVLARFRLQAAETLSTMRFANKAGYFFAFHLDGDNPTFAFHGTSRSMWGTPARLDKKDPDGFAYLKALMDAGKGGGGYVEYTYENPKTKVVGKKIAYAISFEPWNWVLGSGVYMDDIEERAKGLEAEVEERRASFLLWFSLTVALLFALSLGLIFYTAHTISRRLTRFVSVFERMAQGDFTERVTDDGKDEIGVMARSLGTMTDALGELTSELSQVSSDVAMQAQQIASASETLSQRTENAAASLEETSATMEQLTATVQTNAKNSADADGAVKQATTEAQDGQAAVGQIADAMTAVTDSSKKISEIVDLVEELSFQTNLLAINAAVEAAHAGDMGRGFAVVASAVRSLAGRSDRAAKEIRAHIEESNGRISATSELVSKSTTSLASITSSVARAADMVTEIALAGREQASGIEQVNRAVADMDHATQDNATSVEENTAAAHSLATQADHLQDLAGRFEF